jgi:hypothetical protein
MSGSSSKLLGVVTVTPSVTGAEGFLEDLEEVSGALKSVGAGAGLWLGFGLAKPVLTATSKVGAGLDDP